MSEDEKPARTSDREYQFFALRIVGDFGVSIAIPVVMLVLIGQHYDGKFHTSPWLTVAGFGVAALISARLIYKKAKRYGKEYQRLNAK